MYTIYCHVFPNGKRYVGITRTSIYKRWGNGLKYASCPLVNRAIQKYGWDNIKHEVLEEVETLQEAEKCERKYISELGTQDHEKGYNILPGGDVSTNEPTEGMRYKLGNGWRGRSRSEEEKERISHGVRKRFERPESNGHIGSKMSEETRSRMSASQTDRWKEREDLKKAASERMAERMSDPEYRERILNNLSKIPKRKKGEWSMPDSAKDKISKANKGKWIGKNSPCSKPVIQYSKDGVFIKRWENASEVERAGIAARSNVSKCCRGAKSVKTVAGYIWKFE